MTQRNPKTVLAYSSISQMGLLTAVIGMGMITSRDGATAGVIFYAMHHTLVKGGLFLAVGLAPLISARERWLVLVPAAIIAAVEAITSRISSRALIPAKPDKL